VVSNNGQQAADRKNTTSEVSSLYNPQFIFKIQNNYATSEVFCHYNPKFGLTSWFFV